MQVELSSEHFVFTIYACEDFDEEDTRVEEFEVIASNQQEAIQQVRTEVNGDERYEFHDLCSQTMHVRVLSMRPAPQGFSKGIIKSPFRINQKYYREEDSVCS